MTPAAAAARPSSQRASGPIWVDDTLLACANQAFDIALAYRSAEVRLEHLVLAMTRVEPAAAALEARGVRVVSLRRDSAVTIAGELPRGAPMPAPAARPSWRTCCALPPRVPRSPAARRVPTMSR